MEMAFLGHSLNLTLLSTPNLTSEILNCTLQSCIVTMNEDPYKLRDLFSKDMTGTHEVLYIADNLVAQFLPELYEHLENEQVHISMFVTQWL